MASTPPTIRLSLLTPHSTIDSTMINLQISKQTKHTFSQNGRWHDEQQNDKSQLFHLRISWFQWTNRRSDRVQRLLRQFYRLKMLGCARSGCKCAWWRWLLNKFMMIYPTTIVRIVIVVLTLWQCHRGAFVAISSTDEWSLCLVNKIVEWGHSHWDSESIFNVPSRSSSEWERELFFHIENPSVYDARV